MSGSVPIELPSGEKTALEDTYMNLYDFVCEDPLYETTQLEFRLYSRDHTFKLALYDACVDPRNPQAANHLVAESTNTHVMGASVPRGGRYYLAVQPGTRFNRTATPEVHYRWSLMCFEGTREYFDVFATPPLPR